MSALKKLDWEKHGDMILPALDELGIELDQRMRDAVSQPTNSITAYLRSTNARDFHRLPGIIAYEPTAIIPERVPAPEPVRRVFDGAISHVRNKCLGARDYLYGLLVHADENPQQLGRAAVLSDVAEHLSGARTTDLRSVPGLQQILSSIRESIDGTDDYQYAAALEDGRIAFRIVSVLGDYVQESDSGILTAQRALLTHIGRIGAFTLAEVEELEDLMNNARTSERDLQSFFEKHPHFLRKWDHREIHPQVYLARKDQGPLIPDFILTNVEAQDAAVLDIKRTLEWPKKAQIRGRPNRLRFADAIQEACAQLRTYRRWFEEPSNRKLLASKIGMEIYHPRLMVIIGRSSVFRDEIERATLRADNPDIEFATYDDILRYARDRMVIVHDRLA